MSLGSCIVRRGKAAVSVSSGLRSTPREWPCQTTYARRVSTNATARATDSEQEDASLSLGPLDTPVRNFRAPEPDCGQPFASSPLSASRDQSQSGSKDWQNFTDLSHATGVVEDKDSSLNLRPDNSVVRRIVQKAEHNRWQSRNYKNQSRQRYHDESTRLGDHPPPDWRLVLQKLEWHTPLRSERWHDKALKIIVPSEAVGQLLFGMDENIWVIKQRCGCQVEVLSAENGDYQDRVLLLSGPVTSMAKAAAQILQLATNAKWALKMSISHDSNFKTWAPRRRSGHRIAAANPKDVARVVRSVKRIDVPTRADAVPKPRVWTPESFGLYVYQLTHMKVSSHLSADLYSKPGLHTETVCQILRDVFIDRECQSAISTSAINDALEYFMMNSQVSDVRTLFVIVEMRKQPVNTESFNIMLRGAAKRQDLGTFHFILGLMLKKRHTPDSGTWLAFLMVINDCQIKLAVVESMKKKGLFQREGLVKFVCEHLVRDEIEAALDKNMTIPQFVDHMRGRYGNEWLSVSGSNRILDALGNRGLISSCWTIIELMLTANITPNIVTLNTIVCHCERQNNMPLAIEMIRRMCSVTNLQPDSHTYITLFKIAWKANLHQTARVIWQNACLAAETTFLMRNRVYKSIKPSLADGFAFPKLSLPYFKSNPAVGWFILGCKLPPRDSLNAATAPRDEFTPSEEQNMITSPPENSDIEHLFRQTWSRNLSMYKQWLPVRPFAVALLEAFMTDDKLKRSQRKSPNSFDYWGELFRRAPPMDVVYRVGRSGVTKSWETCVTPAQSRMKVGMPPIQLLGQRAEALIGTEGGTKKWKANFVTSD